MYKYYHIGAFFVNGRVAFAREIFFRTLSEKPMAGANTPIVNVNTSNPEEVRESKKTNALLKQQMRQI